MKLKDKYPFLTDYKYPAKALASIRKDAEYLKLAYPDHQYGYTDSLLKVELSAKEFKKFIKWMDGQTCALADTGELVYYIHDVYRGLRFIRDKTTTYWD